MPRARHGKLTDTYIGTLAPKPNGKERIERDGAVPGFLIRVGRRKRSFELRIERSPRATLPLGHWPKVRAADARREAEALWDKHRNGQPLDGGPQKGAESINSTWPLFKARLVDDARSDRTIGGYGDVLKRLHDDIKTRPLRELAADPTIMEREVTRIRTLLHNKKRGGRAMATAAARFVNTLFSFAKLRDPTLLGNPCSAVSTVDPKRQDLQVLAAADLPAWWQAVQEIPREHHREAHLFCLLSGLRRKTLAELEWKYLDLKRRCIYIANPKGGEERGFDLILSRAMIRCLWRARKVSRRLFQDHAEQWVFAGPSNGHVRGDSLTKDGVVANHGLRRTYATVGRASGVPKDSIRRLLNHSGGDVTDHYIRESGLGRLHATEQETISGALVKAMGSPRGLI
jgi:integrase